MRYFLNFNCHGIKVKKYQVKKSFEKKTIQKMSRKKKFKMSLERDNIQKYNSIL